MAIATTFSPSQVNALAEQLGVDVDLEQLRIGMEVELEHGRRDPMSNVTDDDPLLTAKIALAHLRELPDYYDRLAVLEGIAPGPATTVEDVMTASPMTVSTNQPLAIADRLMREHRISGLAVVDVDGRAAGVISRTDLLALGADDPSGGWHGRPVRSAMTAPAITVAPGASLTDAAVAMARNAIHRVVVVEPETGRPLGIVSTMDLVRTMALEGSRHE